MQPGLTFEQFKGSVSPQAIETAGQSDRPSATTSRRSSTSSTVRVNPRFGRPSIAVLLRAGDRTTSRCRWSPCRSADDGHRAGQRRGLTPLAGRIVLLVTSPRLPAGLLTAAAWDLVRAHPVYAAAESDQAEALRAAGVRGRR